MLAGVRKEDETALVKIVVSYKLPFATFHELHSFLNTGSVLGPPRPDISRRNSYDSFLLLFDFFPKLFLTDRAQFEEVVLQELFRGGPLVLVFLEASLNEVVRKLVEALWIRDSHVDNVSLRSVYLIIIERRLPLQQFVRHNPEAPYVAAGVVGLVQYDLWR